MKSEQYIVTGTDELMPNLVSAVKYIQKQGPGASARRVSDGVIIAFMPQSKIESKIENQLIPNTH